MAARFAVELKRFDGISEGSGGDPQTQLRFISPRTAAQIGQWSPEASAFPQHKINSLGPSTTSQWAATIGFESSATRMGPFPVLPRATFQFKPEGRTS